MKKIILVIGILSVVIACEVYTLSYIKNIKGSSACVSSSLLPTSSVVKIDKTNDQTIKKDVQNLLIQDIQSYIKGSVPSQQKLLTALSYSGTIKDIVSVDANKITLSVQDENGKVLQTFTRWEKTKFDVYKKTGSDLLKSDVDHLTKNDKVTVREFNEVIKDSMGAEETKNSVHYVEIIQM